MVVVITLLLLCAPAPGLGDWPHYLTRFITMNFINKGTANSSIVSYDDLESKFRIVRGDLDCMYRHIVGVLPASATSTDRLMWEIAAAYTPFTAAKALSISSSSAADTSISVYIEYLDASWDYKTATITTDASDGQTEKATGITAFRVLSAKIADDTANAGNIYIYDAASAVTAGVPNTLTMVARYINTTCKVDNSCFFTIPNGYEGFLYSADVTLLSSGSASTANDAISYCVRCSEMSGATRLQPVRCAFLASSLGGTTSEEHKFHMPLYLPAKTDIYVNYLNATAANLDATASLDLVLIKSTALDG